MKKAVLIHFKTAFLFKIFDPTLFAAALRLNNG